MEGRARSKGDWRYDVIAVALIVCAHVAYVAFVIGDDCTAYDTYRDTAAAKAMLAGRFWCDPSIADAPFWYPPTNPALMAALSRVAGVHPIDVYASSRYWFNVLTPVLLYLLVRATFDRLTALLSLPLVFLGSCWWYRYFVVPMPPIHGMAINLLALLLWRRCRGPGRAWPWATAAAVALSVWHHPLCGMLLAGAIGLDAVDAGVRSRRGDQSTWRPWRKLAIVGGVSFALASPMVIHMLTLPRLNPLPMAYFDIRLHSYRFALQTHMPFIPLLGAAGAVLVMRRWPAARWLPAYWVLGLVGQAFGYLRESYDAPVPYLLPHEFQSHGQFMLGVLAAVALAAVVRAALPVAVPGWRRTMARLACISVVALGVTGARSISDLHPLLGDGRAEIERRRDLVEWIETHAAPDSVFIATSDDSYVIVAGITGRNCVILPVGHFNMALAYEPRERLVESFFRDPQSQTLREIVARYGGQYVLCTRTGKEDVYAPFDELPELHSVFETSDRTARVYEIRLD